MYILLLVQVYKVGARNDDLKLLDLFPQKSVTFHLDNALFL